MSPKNTPQNQDVDMLVRAIKKLVEQSRSKLNKTVNFEMLLTYWKVGELIAIEAKNYDSDRAFIIELSRHLSRELGKGFSRSNLFNMRKFYSHYSNVQTLSGQLSWSQLL